jgi:transposase-like protein
MRRSRLSWSLQQRLIEHFVSGSTARTAASLVGVNKSTAAFYFHRLREIIALESEDASTIHSVRMEGTSTQAGEPAKSIVWEEDWSARRFRFRHEAESASGHYVGTGDPSQGSFLQFEGQTTQLPARTDAGTVPVQLPAAVLYAILSINDYEVTSAPSIDSDFPNDLCVRVARPPDPLTRQEWLINPVTQLPDQVYIRAYNSSHPDIPIKVGVKYLHFPATSAALVPDTISIDTAGFSETFVFQAPTFNITMQDSDVLLGR